MTESEVSSSRANRVDFETIVENAVRDATELFKTRNSAEFDSLKEAKDTFITYVLDMYAIHAVSVDEIIDEPPNSYSAVLHWATQLFDIYYANSDWDSTPEELF